MLEGIVAKMSRAEYLINQLNSDMTIFLADNYRVESKLDVDSGEYRFYAFGDPCVPIQFSILIGEILYHLRSSLDHAVTECHDPSLGCGDPKYLEFPICSVATNFVTKPYQRKIMGIPASAKAIIERAQPYNIHSGNIEDSTLFWLHELNRIDKHRLLIAAITCVKMGNRFVINPKIDGTKITGFSSPTPKGVRPSKVGTEVFHIKVGGTTHPEMNVEGNFSFQVTFDHSGIIQNASVIEVLVKLGNCAAQWIQALHPSIKFT